MTISIEVTVLDMLEAEARRTMARLALTPNRGFETQRLRAPDMLLLDEILDQYNGERAKA